jgi:hypothetical protein
VTSALQAGVAFEEEGEAGKLGAGGDAGDPSLGLSLRAPLQCRYFQSYI